MSITNEEYSNYITAIATRDLELMQQALNCISEIKTNFNSDFVKLKAIKDALPPTNNIIVTPVSGNIDNLYNQAQGFINQIEYIESIFEANVLQYSSKLEASPNASSSV